MGAHPKAFSMPAIHVGDVFNDLHRFVRCSLFPSAVHDELKSPLAS